MSFSEHKITSAEIASHGVQSRPDKLLGTAAENKAVFDALITEVVKEKLNGLIDALMSASAAGEIGVDTVTGLTAETVQEALEEIMLAMQDITQGSVADGSITTAKLADGAVTAAKLTDGAVNAEKIGSGAVSTGKIADAAVTSAKIALLGITTALLASSAVTAEKIATGAVTGAKIASAAVDNTKLAAGAVTGVKISDGAVTSAKLAAAAVTGEKLADGAVSAEKLSEGINYTAVGLTGDQVRSIYVSDEETESAADGSLLVLTGSGGGSSEPTVVQLDSGTLVEGQTTIGSYTISYSHQRSGANMVYKLLWHSETTSGLTGARSIALVVGEGGEQRDSKTITISSGTMDETLSVTTEVSGVDTIAGSYQRPFTKAGGGPEDPIPVDFVVEPGGEGNVLKLRQNGAWVKIG